MVRAWFAADINNLAYALTEWT